MPFARRGRPGVLGTVARTAVIAGTARATANAVDRRGQERAAQQQPPAMQNQPAAPAPPAVASGGTDDLVAKLTDLARLRDSGALTADEFDAAKARVLSA